MAAVAAELDNMEVQATNNNSAWEGAEPRGWDETAATAKLFECSPVAGPAGASQIQDISVETEDNREKKSAKDALLLWCQMKTAGYPEVNIQNFTTSWRDGLAFNALIHKHRPDLIDFHKLTKSNATYNLQQAFNTAEQHLGLSKLLDPEDVNMEDPDEKSIITYVVSFYHYFSKMKALAVEGKRIGKVLDQAMEIEGIMERYEALAAELLAWIQHTIAIISNQKFANSLAGVQQQLQAFTAFCTLEKPVKFQEKGNLEVLLFTIQSKLRATNRKLYVPSEGKSISDINKAWSCLEKAEHEREVALRHELIRQEKLELLAQRFDHKAAMRETWLNENQRLVSQDNFGYDLPAVEAAMKKHEAIEADISSYQERIQVVVELALEMESEGYYDTKRIGAQKDNILRQWGLLPQLLAARRARGAAQVGAGTGGRGPVPPLAALSIPVVPRFESLDQEMNSVMGRILDVNQVVQQLVDGGHPSAQEVRACQDHLNSSMSEEKGKDEQSTLQLLKKHLLTEQTVENYEETIAQLSRQCRALLELGHPESEQVSRRQSQVDRLYVSLKDLVEERKAKLEQQYWLYQLSREVDELEHWIAEKEVVAGSPELGQDFEHVTLLQEKFMEFASETGSIGNERISAVNQMVDELIDYGHADAATIAEWKDGVNEAWADLLELMETRGQVRQLQEGAAQLRTVYAGENAEAIAAREQEVLRAWKELLASCEECRLHVASAADKIRFTGTARDLISWMDGIICQIGTSEKPRDVSSVEVLMSYHQSLKSEIEARGKSIAACLELGKNLVLAKSPAADEIKAHVEKLVAKKKEMTEKWDQHWEWLQQMLEVHQFAQEAVVADAWLTAQEPLLKSQELGNSVDEVEQLIRRHEAFRKAAAAW
ncbi:PREDICTED: spectrin beta chain, non-erythrocytic 4, partial [Tinamus guttatus]|uniref:spectrin beta chain, non-erythrocytic 4 n=1 Tax=Tinamus guttatus TaxID=94827 RepID=UPI00052EB805